MLSRKDIIEMNKLFSNGNVINNGSLDYAIKTNERSRNWLKTSAMFARAILIDHIFEDGNKRTAAAVIMLLMDMNKVEFNPEKVPNVVIRILEENITNRKDIERCIKDAAI